MTQNKPKPPKTTQNNAKQAIASQKQTENESKWPKTTQNQPKGDRKPKTKQKPVKEDWQWPKTIQNQKQAKINQKET